MKLTIKFNNVSVDLNINESFILINTLAVKRSALRGGFWSTVGKRVEKPLMQILCMLYRVSKENYSLKLKGKKQSLKSNDFEREIDFYLKNQDKTYKCEVKLMGKDNPESADVFFARDNDVFIADKLSDTNKKQLDHNNVSWVELSSEKRFQQFKNVLHKLNILHKELASNFDKELEKYFKDIFQSND